MKLFHREDWFVWVAAVILIVLLVLIGISEFLHIPMSVCLETMTGLLKIVFMGLLFIAMAGIWLGVAFAAIGLLIFGPFGR